MAKSVYQARKGLLAVKVPKFERLESKIHGGDKSAPAFATIANRTDLIELDLVMDYEIDGTLLHAGRDKVLVKGDAGLQMWAKTVYSVGGTEFAFCPEQSVLGFARVSEKTKPEPTPMPTNGRPVG